MSRQLVILVHGMGTHPRGNITRDFKKALSDRAASFGIVDNNFLKNVDYREFNYSEYFDTIRKQFADNARARKQGFKFLTGKGFEETLLNQLTMFESNFGKDEFFYTHWLDVILYSTTYFGEKLRLDLITQFDKYCKIYDYTNVHIVCHSLGTALVHDALAKYYRVDSDPFDDITDVKAGNFNIASLWTFANVSRMVNVLNNLTDPEHSTVTTGSNGCTSFFYNIRNRYDPFTWFRTYDRKMRRKTTHINTVIRNPDTHDFYEYVTSPAVCRDILDLIYGISVSNKKFADADKEYKKSSLGQQAKNLKAEVDAAIKDLSSDSLKDAITHFRKIYQQIDALSDKIKSNA